MLIFDFTCTCVLKWMGIFSGSLLQKLLYHNNQKLLAGWQMANIGLIHTAGSELYYYSHTQPVH